MSSLFDSLVAETLELGATRAKVIEVAKIKFSVQLRKMCAQNTCGKYGSNWMCPPAVGPVEELKARAQEYRYGLLFQIVCQLEDSYDVEGMAAGKKRHDILLSKVLARLREEPGIRKPLPLGAGSCDICPKCTYLESVGTSADIPEKAARGFQACRYPDKAVSSVEAYGIDVLHLVSTNDIPYNNGAATVSYVGLILFNEAN